MIFRFDRFEFDTDAFELRDGGAVIALEPQVFALLQFLIEQRDRVVSKDEIIYEVWDGRIISDTALNTRIGSVRKALGDDGKTQAFIRTFPRRGFRFVADLNTDDARTPKTRAIAATSVKPSIVVLPFENLSSDPEQDYFSDGITEDITTTLSRIPQLFVITRSTAFTYKGRKIDAKAVGAELSARYVLEGRVRKAGNRVRITAQLIDGETGNHMWAERYDRDLEDIFAVQDDVTLSVVSVIGPELEDAEISRALRKPPESLDAWSLYLRGLSYFYRRGPGDLEAAKIHFDDAIELDPTLGAAYARAAQTIYYQRSELGVDSGTLAANSQSCLELAQRAIKLDEEDSNARLAMGMALIAKHQHQEAIVEFEEAFKLNPSSGLTCRWIAQAMTMSGHAEDAMPYFETALNLSSRDPLRGPTMAHMALAKLFIKDFESARSLAQRSLREPATRRVGDITLLASLGHLGLKDEADQARENLGPKYGPQLNHVLRVLTLEYDDYRQILFDGLRRAGVEIA